MSASASRPRSSWARRRLWVCCDTTLPLYRTSNVILNMWLTKWNRDFSRLPATVNVEAGYPAPPAPAMSVASSRGTPRSSSGRGVRSSGYGRQAKPKRAASGRVASRSKLRAKAGASGSASARSTSGSLSARSYRSRGSELDSGDIFVGVGASDSDGSTEAVVRGGRRHRESAADAARAYAAAAAAAERGGHRSAAAGGAVAGIRQQRTQAAYVSPRSFYPSHGSMEGASARGIAYNGHGQAQAPKSGRVRHHTPVDTTRGSGMSRTGSGRRAQRTTPRQHRNVGHPQPVRRASRGSNGGGLVAGRPPSGRSRSTTPRHADIPPPRRKIGATGRAMRGPTAHGDYGGRSASTMGGPVRSRAIGRSAGAHTYN